MNELKGKAEFFQQYIMERFRKLREQRTVATNTEHECETLERPPSFEQLVHDCDEALSAKVRLLKTQIAVLAHFCVLYVGPLLI